MESKWTDRTALLLGGDKMQRLAAAHILVVGVGGVGAYAAEMLCRAGVGEMTIIDADTINVTNINRQLPATHSTIGLSKVEVLANRFRDINPEIRLHSLPIYLEDDEVGNLLGDDDVCQPKYSFIIDAIDTVSGKMELVKRANEVGTSIICSMGTGNKLDPTAFEVADIHKTSVCPLAKVMRGLCKKAGIKHLKVVYSKEMPIIPHEIEGAEKKGIAGRTSPASCSFVPPVAGFILAGEVIKDLIKDNVN